MTKPKAKNEPTVIIPEPPVAEPAIESLITGYRVKVLKLCILNGEMFREGHIYDVSPEVYEAFAGNFEVLEVKR